MNIFAINRILYVALCVLSSFAGQSSGSECCPTPDRTVHVEAKGVRLKMLSDYTTVAPGQEVKVGFLVQHQAGFHSYWKQPGRVGYPLQLDWKSPKLEKAPILNWDVPERVSMNGHPAHGYTREVLHVATLKVSGVEIGEVFTIKVAAAWLACSKSCHPSTGEVELRLPVVQKATVSADLERLHRKPVPPLEKWSVKAQFDGSAYQLLLMPVDNLSSQPREVYCYSEDGQATSSFSQEVDYEKDGSIRITIEAARFGPEVKDRFPCLLYAKNGWGDPAMKYVRINPLLEQINLSHHEK